MSQYVYVQCDVLENVKASILKKAVQNMKEGLDIRMVSSIKNPTAIQENFDAVLMDRKNPTTIGFKFSQEKNKTKLIVAGEFYGTGFNRDTFIQDLCREYQLANVNQMIKENNWNLVSRKVEEDNTVVIRVAV